jgi:hypothetical protein
MKSPLALLIVCLQVFFLTSDFAIAGDCTTSDLNDFPSAPMRNIPVYDQDGTGTCYAHSAAQLVSHWNLKNGYDSSDIINPVYAAYVDHFLVKRSGTLDYGTCAEVINSLRSKGYCKNTKVESCLADFKKLGNGMTDAQLVHYLEVLYKSYESQFKKNPLALKENAAIATNATVKDAWLKNQCGGLNEHYNKNYMGMSIYTATTFLSELFKECKPIRSLSKIPAPKTVHSRGMLAVSSILLKNEIDSKLNAKNPVSISMCAGVFHNKSYRGLSSFTSQVVNESTCGRHAVLVTGRKKIGESCHYLVRNSYGANWHPKNTPCACVTKSGVYEAVCLDASKAGKYLGCWYDQSVLLPNTYSVTYL